jgi:hypothetical protein
MRNDKSRSQDSERRSQNEKTANAFILTSVFSLLFIIHHSAFIILFS